MDAIPPALRFRLAETIAELGDGAAPGGVAAAHLARLLDDGAPWLGADPALADVGHWLVAPARAVELRCRGCAWLAMFPSVESVRKLAALALDRATPAPVRDAGIGALGRRELRDLNAATRWPADAAQLADEALVQLADAATGAGQLNSEALPHALRHVAWDGASAVLARAPGMWGDAIECFASPAFARVLLVCLEDLPPRHRLRALRLVAATLGEEAVPLLVARAGQAPLDQRIEMLLLVVALAGEPRLPLLEDALRGAPRADAVRQRARWHLQHRGVIPTVRGLRVARATAALAPEDRRAACAQAADDLGALAAFERHAEAYVYELWAWMVRGAGDPARARALVAAYPDAQRLVRELCLEDLARRGRVNDLVRTAQALGALDHGALALAIWGRPLAALELAAEARWQTPELACARALACYRAGRPDLAERILAEDQPPAELVGRDHTSAFPGPHERWLAEHAPDARPAVTALAGGRAGVVALGQPAPLDAEPDATSLAAVAQLARRLSRTLAGATVYLAGELTYVDKAALVAAIRAAGARLVTGPIPGTDFYVCGDWCPPQTIARLERAGARRLWPSELPREERR